MKGKYGVPMNAIQHKPKKHTCKQCNHSKPSNKKGMVFCPMWQKEEEAKLLRQCRHYKKKWKDAKASEVKTYYIEREVNE